MSKISARRVYARLRQPARCTRLSRDVERLADIVAHLSDGTPSRPTAGISGTVFGPPGREIHYKLGCWRPMERGAFGPGACGTYVIERSGPGATATGVKARAHVGNIFGLAEQFSRDIARLWGCPPGPTAGFEGARRRRR